MAKGKRTKGQTRQWPKVNGQRDRQRFTKHYTESERPSNTNPTTNRDKLGCSGRVSSSCPISGSIRQCVPSDVSEQPH